MAAKTTRRIVDAIDDLTAQLRIRNQIEALRLGASALDYDKGDRAKTDATRTRVARMNSLRADIRAGLDIKEDS